MTLSELRWPRIIYNPTYHNLRYHWLFRLGGAVTVEKPAPLSGRDREWRAVTRFVENPEPGAKDRKSVV